MKRYIILLFLLLNCSSRTENISFEELSGEWLKIQDEESVGTALFERYMDMDLLVVSFNHYDGTSRSIYAIENKKSFLLGTELYREILNKSKVYKIGPNLIKIERKNFTHYFVRKSYAIKYLLPKRNGVKLEDTSEK